MREDKGEEPAPTRDAPIEEEGRAVREPPLPDDVQDLGAIVIVGIFR